MEANIHGNTIKSSAACTYSLKNYASKLWKCPLFCGKGHHEIGNFFAVVKKDLLSGTQRPHAVKTAAPCPPPYRDNGSSMEPT